MDQDQRQRFLDMQKSGRLPRPGDTVRSQAGTIGHVEATFYENGEGGMHVTCPGDPARGGWWCAADVEVEER